ncbi:transporter gate domain-containing protein [Isoalcanivorax pacificus W11-5]|uniref:Transporter gate domain-containing protein n=1 Tax=Isoalcanivorax pacificus W11-5 TaxID=391936 RepID=A0A0B4XPR5_9GAMM|nr:spore maturation protein [Isoalcanivorax pacificus]AJD48252.1 transporter gate domain-containing protein [Isoalcanivorax pacificus W11-5]
MHYLFIGFLLFGILAALIRALSGDPGALADTMQAMFSAANLAVQVSIGLIGVLTLWTGLFRLAEQSGLADWLARRVAPLLGRLMPDSRGNSQAMAPVTLNLSANMLGLDNAATPLGLKAMQALQVENHHPASATNSQIMFLVLNTSSVTLVPVTVLMYRAQQGAADPADVYLPMLMATTMSTFVGVWLTARIQKIRLLDPVILAAAGLWLLLLCALGALALTLPAQAAATLSSSVGNGILLAVVALFLLMAHRARLDAYSTFIEGAREGFELAVRLIPFLVAMLVAIAVLREGGVLEWLLDGLRWLAMLCGLDTRFVDALPVALLKPLSGSGARAMMLEVMQTHGVDSLAGRMAAVMQGSTETTFYVLAVYFGSVGVVRLRHALVCGLVADFAGLLTAILATYLFFG